MELQQRSKWTKDRDNIKIGSLVVLKETDIDIPPLRWRMALVTKTFPDANGRVRVVEVENNNKWQKR